MIITETERLFLRHVHLFDADALQRVLGDADVMQFSMTGVLSEASISGWIQECLDNYHRIWGFGPWAIVKKSTREVIGYCGPSISEDINEKPEIEIGYRLARSEWGQGYATEAIIAVQDYCFNTLCFPRLVATIDPQHVASIHVVEKAGMRFERPITFPGYDHPDNLYSIENPNR